MYGNSGSGNIVFSLLIILAVLVIIFLICRELVCWYFKINQRLSQQSLIIDLLKDIKIFLNQSNKQVGTHTQMPSTSDYKLVEGETGDAFCAGCRSTSPINGMYHHSRTDTYYHKDCLPK
jgi:hypothetical protein